MDTRSRDLITTTHWGTYTVSVEDGRVTGLTDFAEDGDPSPIGHGIVDVLDGPTRIKSPMVRKSWLEGGPGPQGTSAAKTPSWRSAGRKRTGLSRRK